MTSLINVKDNSTIEHDGKQYTLICQSGMWGKLRDAKGGIHYLGLINKVKLIKS